MCIFSNIFRIYPILFPELQVNKPKSAQHCNPFVPHCNIFDCQANYIFAYNISLSLKATCGLYDHVVAF
jgi:hypothetical protein